MSTDIRVAVVPSAPLLLPAASHQQPHPLRAPIEELRQQVGRALRALPPGPVILAATGEDAAVCRSDYATLGSYGLPHVAERIRSDEQLIDELIQSGYFTADHHDDLHGDLAVLALLVLQVRPEALLVPVTLDRDASFQEVCATGQAILTALMAGAGSAALLAAGDLSAALDAASPGYRVQGARDWDEALLAAVRAGDLAALEALGPEAAARVQARGWAPVVAALSVLETRGFSLANVAYSAPAGVGQLVGY